MEIFPLRVNAKCSSLPGGSDTFFKKGADKDGALKFSATNKDLKNIKYFNISIKSI